MSNFDDMLKKVEVDYPEKKKRKKKTVYKKSAEVIKFSGNKSEKITYEKSADVIKLDDYR